jgi:hypothetical protein
MAKFRAQKNSFVAGEISETALGRTDLPQYPHACRILKNAIPLLQGGAYRRPGTFYETQLDATTDHVPRLIPFVVSKSEVYMLYLGKVIGGTGAVSGFRVTSNISASSAVSFIASTYDYSHSTDGNHGTIGDYDENTDVQYVQSADVLYMVHPNIKPYRVGRVSASSFFVFPFDQHAGTDFRDCYPYLPQNTTATTLSINTRTVGAGRVVTASTGIFTSAHVGAVYKFSDGAGNYGCFQITGYTSSTQVTVQVLVDMGTTLARTTWWEAAWSPVRGWPRTVGFFQGRIVYGGTTHQPDTLWFSETGDYDQQSHAGLIQDSSKGDGATTGPLGSNAFSYTLNSTELNVCEWISSEKTLVVGTSGAEWVLDLLNSSSSDGFACGNVSAVPESRIGSSYHMAVRAGKELVFANRTDYELTSIVFNEVEQAYQPESVQLLYGSYPKFESNIGSRKYRSICWDASRKTLWACDTAGNLFGMTRDRQLQITAWHSHEMGGFDATETGGSVGVYPNSTYDPAYKVCSGSVLSIACTPNPIIGTDDLWMVVKRKVNGVFKYFIERMIGENFTQESAYSASALNGNLYLVDAAAYQVNDFPLTEDYTYSHAGMEGETPDGVVSNSKGIFTARFGAVSGGNTAMQSPYPAGLASEPSIVIVGYGFSTIIQPVRPDVGSQIGSAQGAIKRIHEAQPRFYRTMYAKIGRDGSDLEEINFRTGSLAMGKSAEVYTGDKLVKVDCDYDRDGYLYILCDKPLPFALVSLSAEGMTYD